MYSITTSNRLSDVSKINLKTNTIKNFNWGTGHTALLQNKLTTLMK